MHSYKEILHRRRNKKLTNEEKHICSFIKQVTQRKNLDNISRTAGYYDYFMKRKEIKWSFLASMVSRNAGWNMCDLEGAWFPTVLSVNLRENIFFTYEKANWLIFNDAFPQLLLYDASCVLQKPLFHLLKEFDVSTYMEMEWEYFWANREEERLIEAQIINEQNVIQKPVIENHFNQQKVFDSLPFHLQDWFHFSQVIFPTTNGKLFGLSVYNFEKLDQRIVLGKKLTKLLFHPDLFPFILEFATRQEHTGSRYDYGRWMKNPQKRNTPFLRVTFPVIQHEREKYEDWYRGGRVKKKWRKPVVLPRQIDITNWYLQKQRQLHAGITLKFLLEQG